MILGICELYKFYSTLSSTEVKNSKDDLPVKSNQQSSYERSKSTATVLTTNDIEENKPNENVDIDEQDEVHTPLQQPPDCLSNNNLIYVSWRDIVFIAVGTCATNIAGGNMIFATMFLFLLVVQPLHTSLCRSCSRTVWFTNIGNIRRYVLYQLRVHGCRSAPRNSIWGTLFLLLLYY